MRCSEEYARDRSEKALFIGIGFLSVAVLAEFVCIMILNSGRFVYTLDDPYIHLALAENIRLGHYGVNGGEFSAPSSSILWPFLLAPLSGFAFGEFFPLLINFAAAAATVYFFWKILLASIRIDDGALRTRAVAFFLVLLILGTNTVGLIFSGMEHSLQLLLAVMIVRYLISEIETDRVEPWLIIAVFAAPLIRYENLAVSSAAILYLGFRGYYKLSAFLAASIALTVGGFSACLLHLGLGSLPTSVLAKSSVVASEGHIKALFANFYGNLHGNQGLFLACGMLWLASVILLSKRRKLEKTFAAVISFSILMHLIGGKFGWYLRYEIYIWSVALLTLIYLSKEALSGFLAGKQAKHNFVNLAILLVIGEALTCVGYVEGLFTIPLASNNIYEQQYQMHRFAVEYYSAPVAVDDIGYVSYRNDNYVLDLGGLASPIALEHLKNDTGSAWRNELAAAHGVQFAMVYDSWSKDVPSNWIKMAELRLGRKKITASENTVVFYALNKDAAGIIAGKLDGFRKTLPRGVTFD